VLEYLVFGVLSLVAPLLPPGLAYWLCDRFGDVAYLLLSRQRNTVRGNLRRVMGPRAEGLGRRVRRVFRQGARYYYDTFRIPALELEEFDRMIRVEGWEHLEDALRRGCGVLMFTAHLGSPALVAQILATKGYRVTTPVEPVKSRRLLNLMTRIRGSRGIRLIPLGPASTRELAEALRRNEIVGMVVDRDLQKTGIAVEFFGTETTMPAGPAMLALRTGAVMLPAFTWRRENGLFLGRIGEPMEVERTGDLRRDIHINTRRMARELEKAIAWDPEQWVVFQPIWPEMPDESSEGVAR